MYLARRSFVLKLFSWSGMIRWMDGWIDGDWRRIWVGIEGFGIEGFGIEGFGIEGFGIEGFGIEGFGEMMMIIWCGIRMEWGG